MRRCAESSDLLPTPSTDVSPSSCARSLISVIYVADCKPEGRVCRRSAPSPAFFPSVASQRMSMSSAASPVLFEPALDEKLHAKAVIVTARKAPN
jgi:hypothetical protein